MKGLFLITTLFLISLFIFNSVYAAGIDIKTWITTIVFTKVKVLIINLFIVVIDKPSTWIVGLLAWLASWMILYGFMKMLMIFRRNDKLYFWLSLVISLMGLFIGVTKWIAVVVFNIIEMGSLVIFGLIFIVGIWLFYRRRKAEWGSQANLAAGYDEIVKGLREELAQKRGTLIELTGKMSRTMSAQRRAEVESQMTKLKDEVRSLEDRLEEMRGTFRSA